MEHASEDEKKPAARIIPRSATKSQKGKPAGKKKPKKEPSKLPIGKKKAPTTKHTDEIDSEEFGDSPQKKRPRRSVAKSTGKKRAVKTDDGSPNRQTKKAKRKTSLKATKRQATMLTSAAPQVLLSIEDIDEIVSRKVQQNMLALMREAKRKSSPKAAKHQATMVTTASPQITMSTGDVEAIIAKRMLKVMEGYKLPPPPVPPLPLPMGTSIECFTRLEIQPEEKTDLDEKIADATMELQEAREMKDFDENSTLFLENVLKSPVQEKAGTRLDFGSERTSTPKKFKNIQESKHETPDNQAESEEKEKVTAEPDIKVKASGQPKEEEEPDSDGDEDSSNVELMDEPKQQEDLDSEGDEDTNDETKVHQLKNVKKEKTEDNENKTQETDAEGGVIRVDSGNENEGNDDSEGDE